MVAVLALLAAGQPLTLSLDVPAHVASGSEIVATIWAENRSDKDLILVRPDLPNDTLGVRWKDSLTRDGKTFVRDETGPRMGQWSTGQEIDTRVFLRIKPGQRISFYREKFKAYFTKGFKPGLISEYSVAPRASLPPGTYRLRFQYVFDRTFDQTMAEYRSKGHGWSWEQKLTKSARALYNRTWTGAVEAEAAFEVQ